MDIKEQIKAAHTQKIMALMQQELALKSTMQNSVKKTLEEGRMRRRKSTMAGTDLTQEQIE